MLMQFVTARMTKSLPKSLTPARSTIVPSSEGVFPACLRPYFSNNEHGPIATVSCSTTRAFLVVWQSATSFLSMGIVSMLPRHPCTSSPLIPTAS